LLRTRPQLLWGVVRLLSKRLRATDEALADAVFLDVPARTAKRLLELAGDTDAFTLPVTQELGATRSGGARAPGGLTRSSERPGVVEKELLAV